jgi:hypothetical protein
VAEEDTFGKSTLESPPSTRCNMEDGIEDEIDVSGIVWRYVLISGMKFF